MDIYLTDARLRSPRLRICIDNFYYDPAMISNLNGCQTIQEIDYRFLPQNDPICSQPTSQHRGLMRMTNLEDMIGTSTQQRAEGQSEGMICTVRSSVLDTSLEGMMFSSKRSLVDTHAGRAWKAVHLEKSPLRFPSPTKICLLIWCLSDFLALFWVLLSLKSARESPNLIPTTLIVLFYASSN
jgi:hypothetical protein